MDSGLAIDPALGLDTLPRVAAFAAPSPEAFERLVAAEAPVVIKGLVDGWPALAAARSPQAMNAYLKAMDSGLPGPVMEAPASSGGRYGYGADLREFSFSKRNAGVSQTLDRIQALLGQPDAPFVAIQMLPLATHMPEFARRNPMPLVSGKVMPRLWVGGPLRTQTHNDRDHNLACVLAGRRRFVLFPPEQVSNLYVGPLEAPPPLSLVDPEAPDLVRFPRYRDAYAAARVAWLEPGDALFMPKHWWHHVTSLEPYNAMVNYWWGDTAVGLERPADAFQIALLALKDLPSGEKAYWREMFAAYVFGDRGEATAHIPESLRGMLGALSPVQRAALKQQLKMAVLRSPA
jgi:hypothetical protein